MNNNTITNLIFFNLLQFKYSWCILVDKKENCYVFLVKYSNNSYIMIIITANRNV